MNEIRLAARTLAKTPGFAAVAVLVLSLGIAVSTAAFAVVNTLVRRPIPYPNPERLVLVGERNVEKGFTTRAHYQTFARWRDQSRSFQELGAVEPGSFTLGGANDPENVAGARATGGFFSALGWTTILGRNFTREEQQPGARAVVLISQRCWERRFGSDPNIIGHELLVDGQSAAVVGVLSRIVGRSYYASHEVWSPLAADPGGSSGPALEVVGLLKPGIGFAEVRAELDVIERAASLVDHERAGWTAAVVPMKEIMAHTVPMFVILFAVVILLLLVVCANMAALQMARSLGRQPEVAVRIANEAVQIHGGYGFIKDYPVEKFYRDVKLCTIGEGTSEIQRLVIARQILKD